ncbi:Lipopolysaccharide export system protein lptC [Anaerobiospirillum thomasii]|uniref:Lipopolysaccharide export system protein lptC n=2 Tax=Anaerobiospirillum thomasii TaxID=179995 RepID=A0A2X0V8H7_9GAMM|nr:LPS export ABC transporter periplasmic protein LptC [Anaerobiospirillum thomasii]SPT69105.1 Lipopolysaccharide export system protein lptC [Anaerobiospirillum thomasii]SPT72343.1 Lipopolysaccharide export system protein lptC [Anaerobiospirillum thomasii]
MSTTIKSIIMSFILVIVSIVLYRFTTINDGNKDDIVANLPAFESSGFQGRSYSEHGDIKYEFSTSHVVFYKKDEVANIRQPQITYYEKLDNDRYRTYELTADEGTIKLHNFATLKGNILVVPKFKDAFISSIRAENMRYDLMKGIISSHDFIEIVGPNFKNTGSDFKIDLNKKQFRITDGPHATYFNN